MLARIAESLPSEAGFLFEPKWDGFRALVFRTSGQTLLQSRDLKPLNRYFPELEAALQAALPKGCVLDGEIVVASPRRLDFDALQQRIDPAASRIAKLALETPARFVAFNLLGASGRSTMALPQAERRVRLERLIGSAKPPPHLMPMTRDRAEAERWSGRTPSPVALRLAWRLHAPIDLDALSVNDAKPMPAHLEIVPRAT